MDARFPLRCAPLGIVLEPVRHRSYWEGHTEPGLTTSLTVRLHRHEQVDEVAYELIAHKPGRAQIAVRGEWFADSDDAWDDMRDAVHAWSADVLFRDLVHAEDCASAKARAEANAEAELSSSTELSWPFSI